MHVMLFLAAWHYRCFGSCWFMVFCIKGMEIGVFCVRCMVEYVIRHLLKMAEGQGEVSPVAVDSRRVLGRNVRKGKRCTILLMQVRRLSGSRL